MATLEPNDIFQDRGVIKVTDGTHILDINNDGSIKVIVFPAATDIEAGKITVGTSAIEVTFSGTPITITITADPTNSGTIYVGESNIASNGDNAGWPLVAGASVSLDYDDTTNAIYVISNIAAQTAYKAATL